MENTYNKVKVIKREILSTLKTICIAVLITMCVMEYIFVIGIVPSCSMENTVMTNSKIIIDKFTYRFIREPQRFDIIVFDNIELKKTDTDFFLKRIIGMPGETIECINNIVYINGEIIDEPFLDIMEQPDFGPYTIPEEEYFVLGDNRNNSLDSRYWNYKFVRRDEIMGCVSLVITPKFESIKYKEKENVKE